jgi:hypothetical protein
LSEEIDNIVFHYPFLCSGSYSWDELCYIHKWCIEQKTNFVMARESYCYSTATETLKVTYEWTTMLPLDEIYNNYKAVMYYRFANKATAILFRLTF